MTRCLSVSRKRSGRMFDSIKYTVKKINGDYAIMTDENGIENTVAMALLPIEITEGDTVLYENFVYTIL